MLLRLGDSIANFRENPQSGMTGSFTFISIDYPGATTTNAYGLNSRGDVVGRYVDSAGHTRGLNCQPPASSGRTAAMRENLGALLCHAGRESINNSDVVTVFNANSRN
jgi:hypothetical protein